MGERMLKLERRPLLMLQLLATRSGEVIPRAELLDRVWGSTYTGFEHSLEQAVHQIRRELKEPGWIETVSGSGYRIVVRVCARAGPPNGCDNASRDLPTGEYAARTGMRQ